MLNLVSDPGSCFVLTVISIICHRFRPIIVDLSTTKWSGYDYVRWNGVKISIKRDIQYTHFLPNPTTMSNWWEPGWNLYKWSFALMIIRTRDNINQNSWKDWFCVKELRHQFNMWLWLSDCASPTHHNLSPSQVHIQHQGLWSIGEGCVVMTICSIGLFVRYVETRFGDSYP